MSNFAPNTGLSNGFYIVLQTSADMDGKEGYMVTVGTDGRVALTGDGAAAHGWITNVIETGTTGKVEVQLCTPWVKAIAGAAIAEGDDLASDSAARVTGTTTTGDRIVGIALEAATAAGDAIKVLPVVAPVLAL